MAANDFWQAKVLAQLDEILQQVKDMNNILRKEIPINDSYEIVAKFRPCDVCGFIECECPDELDDEEK